MAAVTNPEPAPVVALVPAAGSSRRMGRAKLLLPFRGTTVLGATVDALRAGGAGGVLLVTGPLAGSDAARELGEWATGHGVGHAVNPDPARGMLSTLLAGLAALGGAPALARAGTRLLVAPGDLPRLSADTVRATLAALEHPAILVAVPRYRGRNGHPMAIAGRAIADIPSLDPARGLRALRDRHADALAWVEVEDPGAVADVDTPEDYAALTGDPARASG